MSLKKIEISVGLIKFKSSYICLKRNKKPYENHIEFPGGKKKNNESAAQCLVREIKEELNIKINKFKPIGSIKHLYDDTLITINVFNIHRFSGDIFSNEGRDIIFYDTKSTHYILPTHDRILNLSKVPRLLKIFTPLNKDDSSFEKVNLYNYIRLKDISYEAYINHILPKLNKYHFRGKLIIDYPYNESWQSDYSGIHFKSSQIERSMNVKKNKKYLYSASCHTLNDIKLSNKILFDFILISPILSSPYNHKPIGWTKFNDLSEMSYVPTIALGGLKSLDHDLTICLSNKGFGLAGIKSI